MSNIGKSQCAKRLASKHGFRHIDCDALIEQKLAVELSVGGYRGLDGMAEWMGFPSAPQYEENSRRYIACEIEVMRDIFDNLKQDDAAPVVIDTTGSVIYTGAALLETLRATTTVIYFEASEQHVADLFTNYIAHPKPVIWGDKYVPLAGETPQQTLERCYPELLRDRARRYQAIAHRTIPYEQHKNHKADIAALLADGATLS